MRLAIADPAGHRRADARRLSGVHDVEVEADVEAVAAGLHHVQRLAHHGGEALAVDVLHCEHRDACLPQQGLLGGVEVAHTHQRHPPRIHSGPGPDDVHQTRVAQSAQRGQRHAVNVAREGRVGCVEVAVRIDPE